MTYTSAVYVGPLVDGSTQNSESAMLLHARNMSCETSRRSMRIVLLLL